MTSPIYASLHTKSFADDGLAITTVESWARQKVNLVRQYLTAFVAAVENQVDEMVFVDLYAKNGLCCLGARDDIFAGIPLMALSQPLPIHKYVFCESDAEQFRDLKIRINRYFKQKNTVLLEGKPADLQEKLKLYVPAWRKSHRVAVFCVADSFLPEPDLSLVRHLGDHGFSFLIPLTFHLNATLDFRFYLHQEASKLKHFAGEDDLQKVLGKNMSSNRQFYKRLTRWYEEQVRAHGMQTAVAHHKMDSGLMEMPSYAMFLLSALYPAKTIQAEALASGIHQFNLFNTSPHA